ncbi:MAG TPA: hypothetical protein VFP72_18420 [Kineosporiaceae bacterium]|nr:hypothetical protein [Kineosporiaceae bacterium]
MSAMYQQRMPRPGRRAGRLYWQYLCDGPGEVLIGAFTSSSLQFPAQSTDAGDEAEDQSLLFGPKAWGLVLPADVTVPCQVRRVPMTATGISASIGGGVLAETPCLVERGIHTIYQDADREVRGLPANERAFRLAARLGWPHVERRISLRGTAVVLGLDCRGEDTHVPAMVLEAAIREGLLPGGRARLVLSGSHPAGAAAAERRAVRVPEENAS